MFHVSGFKRWQTVLMAAAVIGASGCVRTAPSNPIAQNAPEWVNKKGGAFKSDGKPVFYGVGLVSGVRNRALAVTASDDRAAADIAKIMERYVAVLTKDYMASTTAGDMNQSSEEQHISSTLKSFTKTTLHGVTIIDHWRDPSDGTLFALAKLDMEAIKGMLDGSRELDAKMRDFVRANADRAFDELAAEEAKPHTN